MAMTFSQPITNLAIRPRRIKKPSRIASATTVRKKEAREAGIDTSALSEAALIKAMLAMPAIIERPIVVAGNKAVLGRPPENVLDIL